MTSEVSDLAGQRFGGWFAASPARRARRWRQRRRPAAGAGATVRHPLAENVRDALGGKLEIA
jgi:hypothetical protein